MRVWDADSGRELRRFGPFPEATSWALAFSPDGSQVLFEVHHDVLQYEVDTGREVRRLTEPTPEGQGSEIRSVAFAPDGRVAAYGVNGSMPDEAWRGSIRLWEVASGRELRRLEADGGCFQLTFTADGKGILSAHGSSKTGRGDDRVRLRDVETGRELLSIGMLEGGPEGVALSPGGRRILTASTNGSVQLWDAATGRELHRFEGHRGGALGAAFSPDGRMAASGGKDGIVRLWRLPVSRDEPGVAPGQRRSD